jgi:GMP synthase-like glutamine amidotransferase
MTRRIGLLECDHVDDRYLHLAGDYRDMFAALLGNADAGSKVDLIPYPVSTKGPPASSAECDGWVITGSRRSVYEDVPWIGELSRFVTAVSADGAPCVGVCFGHQLLAHALGGRTEPAPAGWGVGAHRIRITRAEPWMEPAIDAPNLLFMHQDQVTVLPPGAVVVGSAEHCPIAMFRLGATVLGIQAHPEFAPPYVHALLDARVARIGEERAADARASLDSPVDSAAVGRWLVRFLDGAAPAAGRGVSEDTA